MCWGGRAWELRAALADGGVLDRIRILVSPAALGTGQRLFGHLRRPLHLRLASTRTFDGGAVMVDYEVEPEGRSSTPSS
jgi:dihydrofolate reductase